MKQINFDNGIEEFLINGSGVLRFNPADPNVYDRFLAASEKIQNVEMEMEAKGKELADDDGAGRVHLVAEGDQKIKEHLNWVFGTGNDFNEIMGGVNLMAVAGNGERVITNLLQALIPIIEDGAKRCTDQQVGDAVKKAQGNRAARRAKA